MAGYIGSAASVVSSGAERKKTFTITGATTSLTGLNYTVGKVHVYQNGVRLVDGTDYTATNSTTITLTVAAQNGDNVVVISQADFQVSGAVSTSGDTMTGDLSFGDNDKAIFGAGSDLQIYHSGSHSVIKDAGDGNLQLIANDFQLRNGADNANMMTGANGGAVTLMHNGSSKLATTSTGIDVTGTAVTDGLTVTQSGATFTPSSQTVALFQRNTATGSGAKVCILAGNLSSSDLNFGDVDNEDQGRLRYEHNNDAMTFTTNGSERMRITSAGYVGMGVTSPAYPLEISLGQSSATVRLARGNTSSGFKNIMLFRSSSAGADVGAINITNSATQYATSSDYRLKENVVDLTGASARVNQLNPSRFNFIADGTDTVVDGFLAHEVADVVPEAISGTKDAMMDEEYEVTPAVLDDDGNVTTEAVMGTRSVPNYQGIDQSKLVPLLTAALQEALTEIASLKTRVQALEDV